MKRVLGRKQVSRNIDWLEAMRHIEELISLDEVKAYETTAVERIAKAADGKVLRMRGVPERTALSSESSVKRRV